MKLIDKAAVLAEIENLLDKGRYHEEYDCVAYRDGNNGALYALKNKLAALEVKEVNLEKEYKDFIKSDNGRSMFETAKHFFNLGMTARNKAQKGE